MTTQFNNKRIYGVVEVFGCPDNGRAVITGRESYHRFWVIMLTSGWHCIVHKDHLRKIEGK